MIDLKNTSGYDYFYWKTKEEFDVYEKRLRKHGCEVYPKPERFPCHSFCVADIPRSCSLDEEVHFFIYED